MFWKHRRSFRKAQTALEKNDYVSAEQELSKLLEEDAEAIEALLHRALTRLRLQKPEEALLDAEKVTQLRPDNGLGFMIAGEVLLALGKYQEAYEQFQKACGMERDNGRAFYGWARACVGLGKKEEAGDYFETALQFERDYVLAQTFSEVLTHFHRA